jgi:MFS family permease
MLPDFLKRSSPLWSNRDFSRVWAAQALSAVGSRVTRTAIPIIAVSVLAASPGEAALLSALTYAPYVLAGVLLGGFVERANKLRLMVATDLVRFAIVIAAPAAWMLGVLNFPLLCVLATAAGAASALFQNADTALLPRLVGREHLVEANSRTQATESVAELTGPGLAGILIDLVTAPIAMILDALTFLWSALWLARIDREKGRPAAAPERHASPIAELRADIRVGLTAILRRPPLRAILISTLVFYVSAGFFFAEFMLFLLRDLHLTPSIVGVVVSLGGASALLGTFAARPLARRIGYGPALVAGFAIGAAGMLMLIPAALLPYWGIVFLAAQQLLGDCGIMIFTVLASSLQQRLLPETEIARANGFNQSSAAIGMTVAILIAGLLAETVGVPATIMSGAGLAAIAVLPLLTPSLLGMREAPEAEIAEAAPEPVL